MPSFLRRMLTPCGTSTSSIPGSTQRTAIPLLPSSYTTFLISGCGEKKMLAISRVRLTRRVGYTRRSSVNRTSTSRRSAASVIRAAVNLAVPRVAGQVRNVRATNGSSISVADRPLMLRSKPSSILGCMENLRTPANLKEGGYFIYKSFENA